MFFLKHKPPFSIFQEKVQIYKMWLVSMDNGRERKNELSKGFFFSPYDVLPVFKFCFGVTFFPESAGFILPLSVRRRQWRWSKKTPSALPSIPYIALVQGGPQVSCFVTPKPFFAFDSRDMSHSEEERVFRSAEKGASLDSLPRLRNLISSLELPWVPSLTSCNRFLNPKYFPPKTTGAGKA